MSGIPHTVEVIARGVCIENGMILLCRGKKSALTYLPGGHIEFQETARQALSREVFEELGHRAEVGAYLGCCEHSFIQQGEPKSEINLIFSMTLPDLEKPEAPGEVKACEDWIVFKWHPLAELATTSQMEPAFLRTELFRWLAAPGGHCETGTFQGS